ncbi:glycoside hydrolase family protein [Venturia nashicola]|uniref:Glycoside hydrolase family protein n=1 Tax=Venturia nashicola TaxID=86259 RepID=A0A4Z1PQI3_9PEZI|nr:glycoside hydrolase family protein [Venturia nashicola]TLD37453.1 glycoside hydrolase family protein [Venturia nashicola]
MISLLGAIALFSAVTAGQCDKPAPTCPIVLDGRVPSTANLATFDTKSSPFSPDNVKGPQKWSEILKLPKVPASRFDLPGGQPVEVVINDKSIFSPGGKPQNGFRRAGLIPAANSGTDPSTVGIKTFHWSVRQSAKKLNTSHEYINVWHERNDYNGNQFNFQTGALIGKETLTKKDDWKVLGKDDKVIWSGGKVSGEWENFAITLDYTKNTAQLYHSVGNAPLKSITGVVKNDNSGGGQMQIGLLKKPTGTKDVVNSGTQQSNFEESLIFGGIFVEDSANGCVSK